MIVVDLEFFFLGGVIVFFQVLRHRYLKTAQFINLRARLMRGVGKSGPLLNPPLESDSDRDRDKET